MYSIAVPLAILMSKICLSCASQWGWGRCLMCGSGFQILGSWALCPRLGHIGVTLKATWENRDWLCSAPWSWILSILYSPFLFFFPFILSFSPLSVLCPILVSSCAGWLCLKSSTLLTCLRAARTPPDCWKAVLSELPASQSTNVFWTTVLH